MDDVIALVNVLKEKMERFPAIDSNNRLKIDIGLLTLELEARRINNGWSYGDLERMK